MAAFRSVKQVCRMTSTTSDDGMLKKRSYLYCDDEKLWFAHGEHHEHIY